MHIQAVFALCTAGWNSISFFFFFLLPQLSHFIVFFCKMFRQYDTTNDFKVDFSQFIQCFKSSSIYLVFLIPSSLLSEFKMLPFVFKDVDVIQQNLYNNSEKNLEHIQWSLCHIEGFHCGSSADHQSSIHHIRGQQGKRKKKKWHHVKCLYGKWWIIPIFLAVPIGQIVKIM